MGWYKQWANKQKGNPVMLVIAAITATLGLWIGHRYYYKPWSVRKRMLEAEEYANMLLKNEETK